MVEFPFSAFFPTIHRLFRDAIVGRAIEFGRIDLHLALARVLVDTKFIFQG
jgi:hypothetical protein